MKKVVFAGNMIVDNNLHIDSFPNLGMLEKIKSEDFCVGGSPCNSGIDFKTIDPSFEVSVIGKIGKDDKGKFILETFKKHNIITDKVLIENNLPTSYTDCFIDSFGRRTMFTFGGAGDCFDPDDINIDDLHCDLFHFGYLLLSPKFDQEDKEYGTRLARLLKSIQNKGIKTSIDVISENSDRFSKIVIPSLRYCDYVIINEIEASNVCNIPVRDKKDRIIIENLHLIINKLLEFGVKNTVIVHCPELAIIKRIGSKEKIIPSFKVKDPIISNVGAGDAFLAGALYGLINDFDDENIVNLGHASALNNLYSPDTISGAKSLEQLTYIIKNSEKNILKF